MSNTFASFSRLHSGLQVEALREGEERLQAQLAIASAADTRAMTWSGLLVAAITGSLGAAIALVNQSQPDYLLAFVATLFAGALLYCSHLALSTVEPKEFHIPGNTPEGWLPECWGWDGGDILGSEDLARQEQAEHLSTAIAANSSQASAHAQTMRKSFNLTRWTIGIAAFAVFLIVMFRALPPSSESAEPERHAGASISWTCRSEC